MSTKTERSSKNTISNIEGLAQSLDEITISGNTKERIQKYTQVMLDSNIDIDTKDATPSQGGCFRVNCQNIFRAVSCCGFIRCCGSDNYYISIQNDQLDSSSLQKKISRRQLPPHTNRLTNTYFLIELYNTYGAEDFPVLFQWTLRCLPRGLRHYWEQWVPTSEEPLDRKKADIFQETMKEAFNLMRTLRIEKLKQDFIKEVQAFSRQVSKQSTASSTSSSSSNYRTPTEETTFDFPPTTSGDIQAEASPRKETSMGTNQIKFDSNVIIKDVMLITGCNLQVAKGIAESVKSQVTQETTRQEIWSAVKLELISRQLTTKGNPDPALIAILTEYSVEKIKEIPLERVSSLAKNKSIKKIVSYNSK